MADIRIVPGSSIMSFTSSLNFTEKITQDPSGSLNLYGSGSTGRTELFSIDGNNGRLFTVSDDLSDSLFSVNTIAGLPVIEAFANNTVVMGQYGTNALVVSGSNVGIGTTDPKTKLHSYGGTFTLGNEDSYSARFSNGSNKGVIIGYDTTNNKGHIGSINPAVAWTDLILNANGGNVGIGNTSPSYKLDISGTGNASSDFRAPIFYDSNNTGYYVDPASTSNLYSLSVGSSMSLFGGYGGGSGPGLGFENQSTFCRLAFFGLDFYDWNDGIQMTINNNHVAATNSFRAPIFYDSNNTGYYIDPASTSVLNALTVGGSSVVTNNGGTWGISITGNAGTVGGYSSSTLWRSDGGTWNPGYNITLNQTANDQEWSFDINRNGKTGGYWQVWDSGNSTILKAAADTGRVSAPYSFDTPIFYDSNNTGYYCDPSNISKLYEANFGDSSNGNQGINIYYGNTTGGYGKIRFYQAGSNHQTIHSFSANWQGGGFGTTNSAGAINIDGNAGVTFGNWNNCDAYIQKGGNFWCRYDVIAYSDARLKDNVEVITNALDKISKVRGVTFTRNDYEDKEKRHTGVIAQEILEILPEAVTESSDGIYSVAYGNLAGLFIEAIKEQQKQIDELKKLIK